MSPARKGDGTGLSFPGYSEVRTGDGTVLWSAGAEIPDSGVHHGVASDFNGTDWVADIGPDMPVSAGSPELKSKSYRNKTIDVVECQGTDNDHFQTTNLALDGSYCVILVVASREGTSETEQVAFNDAVTANDFIFLNETGDDWRIFMNDGVDTLGGTPDTNLNVWTYEIIGTGTDEVRLYQNETDIALLTDSASSVPSLSGWTLNARGDGTSAANHDIAEWTVLEDHTSEERDAEVSRLVNKYNI